MQNTTVEMENKAMAEVVSFGAKKKVPLEETMDHRITDECLLIFSTNGIMVKVQNSKLAQCCIGGKPLNGSFQYIFLSWTWDASGSLQHLLLKTEKRMIFSHLRGRIAHQSYFT